MKPPGNGRSIRAPQPDPWCLGRVGNFPPGAPVAASQQFGVSGGQTDVLVVDNSSTLTVSWVAGGGQWSVSAAPTPN